MVKQRILSGTGLFIAAVLATTTIILANTVFTGLRLDLTENKLFTLSDGTSSIIQSLEEPVMLDFYFSRKAMIGIPQLVNYADRVRDLLDEYAKKSSGKIILTVIEPEPFSEEEDQAVASGLQGVSANAANDPVYFGLVGTNSVDNEVTIPFFQPNREAELEYDLTKLIYNLAHPEKRTIGILSGLPQIGNYTQGMSNQWTIMEIMSEFFNIRSLLPGENEIKDIDVLFLVHPKEFSEETLFAIDQYLLGGGKAMIFVDPMAEAENPPPGPQAQFSLPNISSTLDRILDGWGIVVSSDKIVGDMRAAIRVQTQGDRGIEETNYLPWLQLDGSNLNDSDFVTSDLNTINMGSAGAIEKKEDSPLEVTPLIESSTEAMTIDPAILMFQRNPAQLISNFKSEDRTFSLAARLSGTVKTAFPDGLILTESGTDEDEEARESIKLPSSTEGNINAILIADTDILSDSFWINKQSLFGIEIPQTIADNGNFIINALDNLSGSNDLISLRSRGEYSRPFNMVNEIRREAEQQYHQQEKMLETKLAETEQKLLELQKQGAGNDLILSDEQSREIERFRQEQLNTRKELRAVQHELHKNIERLGTVLKFINIGLIPLMIAVAAVAMGLHRVQRASKLV